ncbi:TPR-like protein [Hortaea werneckii]|nr:TPR-like protein [Hortaea werneckii]KAI7383595.1 TPR-like protein [Hortaea werneckii]
MSPTTGIAASQLHQLIYYHIDNDMLETANFLAGRLHALEPRNPDSAHLMALTYYRLRRFKATYDFSQKYGASGRHLGCAYVFAQACLELGRYTEGCAALEKARVMWTGKINWKKHSETTRRHLPDAPAVYTLMAKLWRGHGDMKKAGDCYIEAHKANPFIWDAFEGLCRVGADLNVHNMFRVSMGGAGEVGAAGSGSGGLPDVYTDDQTLQSQPLAAQSNFNQQVFTPTADPFASGRAESEPGQFAVPKGKSALGRGLKQPPSDWDTPTVNAGMLEEDDVAMGGMQLENEDGGLEPPAAPVRRTRPGHHGEASERPRQPTLRAHGQSSSEALSAEDQRKPSISHIVRYQVRSPPLQLHRQIHQRHLEEAIAFLAKQRPANHHVQQPIRNHR